MRNYKLAEIVTLTVSTRLAASAISTHFSSVPFGLRGRRPSTHPRAHWVAGVGALIMFGGIDSRHFMPIANDGKCRLRRIACRVSCGASANGGRERPHKCGTTNSRNYELVELQTRGILHFEKCKRTIENPQSAIRHSKIENRKLTPGIRKSKIENRNSHHSSMPSCSMS